MLNNITLMPLNIELCGTLFPKNLLIIHQLLDYGKFEEGLLSKFRRYFAQVRLSGRGKYPLSAAS